MEKNVNVLDCLGNGKLPLRKWQITEIIEGSL